MKILLTLSYDGTKYSGWQIQENAVTVQQRINEGLSRLYTQEISVLGASRTDAGVHAICQKAVFSVDKNPIPPERLPYALNSFLPKDIVVTRAEYVSDDFHPINDAKLKTYEYRIKYGDFLNPKERNYCEFVKGTLDIEKMQKAAVQFLGRHDFKGFSAAGSSVKTTIREIFEINIVHKNSEVLIIVTGDGFLYNMVRIIAGTLIYVGQGKINENDITAIIKSKDRSKAGKTAGPQGLTLINIVY